MRLEMTTLERELDRVLTLLRNKIRERGFTQLEVQEALSWGRSYISQLLTKQKSLRVEQVLMILDVIGVPPSEFFGELYHFAPMYPSPIGSVTSAAEGTDVMARSGEAAAADIVGAYREMSSLLQGLLRLLVERNIVDPDELQSAIRTSQGQTFMGPSSSGG